MYKFASAILFLTGAMSAVEAGSTKCYALALSSGDESSAYQAGVIKGLVNSLPADEVAYSSLSGVSGGALNSVVFSSFPVGQEKQAAEKLEQMWVDASNTKLYKNWLGTIVEGMFYKGGLYNSAPLNDFIASQIKGLTLSRQVNVGITDVLTGLWKDFNNGNMDSTATIGSVLYASFAFPGFFAPVKAFDTEFFDGSAVWDIDIFTAINKCLETTKDHSDVTVDVILTSAANLKKVDAENYKSISMLFRFLEISSYYNAMDGLLRAKFAYPKVNFRYAIAPSKNLPSSLFPMDLNEKQVKEMMALGESDAASAIKLGHGMSVDYMEQFHHLKKTGHDIAKKMEYGEYVEAREAGVLDKKNLT